MTGVVDHLIRLGLSEYEAKAYIATVALGQATVKEISTESGVPRSRAYDVMEKLAERGFVQIGNSNPRCYRANEPMMASSYLMEEIKRANDEVVRELSEIGKKAEKRDNPIWTLKGEWAIDHKATELMESARSEVAIVSFNNRDVLRHAQALTRISEDREVSVVFMHHPESFIGLLGKTRILRARPMPNPAPEFEGILNEKGYTTKDGRYCVELIMLVDKDTSFILSREGESRRAIIITGTVLSLFSHETVRTVIDNAEEVRSSQPSSSRARGKARSVPS